MTAGAAPGEREVIVKVVGGVGHSDVQESNAAPGVDEAERMFTNAGAIEAPFNPRSLVMLYEMSTALRQNIDAYATNIDGFGHRLEPIIDFDAADADDRIAQAMYLERMHAMATPGAPPGELGLPTPDEVAAKKSEMVALMRLEKSRLERFFDFCCEDLSFVALRKALRSDREQQGNAYMEVLRNGAGEIAELVYVPAFTMRLLPIDKHPTEIRVRRRISDIDYHDLIKRKNMRRYVQVFEARIVFFKEFGDPRVMSRQTGGVFDDLDDLLLARPNDGPATEMIHFRERSARTAYGIPRWVGNMPNIIGARQADEVNQAYFENKSVPPMALLVSGGRLVSDSIKRLENFIETEVKGKKNFHKILIIEADSGAGSSVDNTGNVKIEMKPLTDAQQKDALFQQYDERSMDKVGMAFRLPRLLRGDVRDFNRATADAALDFTEQQVFGPEREDFDFFINRRIIPELGIRFWRFVSNAPAVKDPEKLSKVIVAMTVAGVITPGEARELAQAVFNRDFKKIHAPWAGQPLALTLAGFSYDEDGALLDPYTGEALEVDGAVAAYDDLDADGQPDEPEKSHATPQITRTALGSVITVNEARAAHGLGAKTLASGAPDPDGGLTIAEYLERAKARVAGSEKGTSSDVDVSDLASGGGLLAFAQGASLKIPGTGRRRRAAAKARELLQLHDAFVTEARRTSEKAWLTAQQGELAGTIPAATIRKALPREDLSEAGLVFDDE